MLFPTVDFAIFFVLVFVGHWLLNHLAQPWKWFMIAASYVFYAWWDPRFVLLLVGVSVLAQLGAIAVSKARTPRARLVVNGVAVTLLLLPLAFFKYYGFFAVNVTNTLTSFGMDSSIPLIQVVLPVGISFFTFMAIAYVVDVFRGDFEVAGWTDVFLYLSFFPHLVAGPIVRPGELIPQIRERRDERHVDVAGAAWMILGGLFKKVVVSSYLAAQIVDPVFGDPFTRSAPDALFAILGYAIVIYADFSGYTDIAIGIAKLLGFRFPKNFDRPYAASSIQDFWRRWHMTLSRWLRDYLYIPLGGNRRGARRTLINIFVTMLLGGLWHGAAWTFVFWGAYHGALLAAEQWRRQRASGGRGGPRRSVVRRPPSMCRHVRARVRGMGLLPGGFPGHGVRAAPQALHRLVHAQRVREPSRRVHDRRDARAPVLAPRPGSLAPVGPLPAQARAPRRRPGARPAGDRDPGTARRGTLHLLPVLMGTT